MEVDLEIRTLTTIEKAEEITRFFFDPESFDDTRHTPGEIGHFRNNPLQSLHDPNMIYWYVDNADGEVIAVFSFLENEQRTGGYLLDYMVVHRRYRQLGIAEELMRNMFRYLHRHQARYVMTYTCDLPEYEPARQLFVKFGFRQVGHCPDYYFPGEGRVIYHKQLEGN